MLATRGGERATAQVTAVAGNSFATIDPRTAQVTATYPAGSTPTSVTAGTGGAWALNADDGTVTHVADRTSAPRTFSLPDTPTDLAVVPGGVWVLTGGDGAQFRLVELEPSTGAVLRTITLPRGENATWFSLNRLAAGRDVLWAVGGQGRLSRVDLRTGSEPTVVKGLDASSVVASGAGAWAVAAAPRGSLLARISPAGRVTARVPVVAPDLDGLAVGAGAVWATSPQDGQLWRVTPEATRSVDVGAGARGVALAGGSVWVTNASRGTVTRFDPRSNRITAVVRIGNAPRALASGGDRLWVTVAAGGGVPVRDAERAVTGAVTAPACSGLVTGAGTPDRVIVSDLPLHNPDRASLPDAIAFVLRQHGFRAGRFDIGYQSCDDSTAKQGDFEPEKCRANAALFAQTPRVIGVIGPFNSDCATEQLAITNRAPGGPLAMISPSNTSGGLTKPLPGGPAGQMSRLYPTGRRHYARLIGADDGTGAALMQFARSRGFRRVAIVEDDTDYGHTIAWNARRAARRLGVGVTGSHRYRLARGAGPARALGRRIALERPDALLHASVPWWGPSRGERPAFGLLLALGDRLGRRVPVLAPDSWADGSGVFDGLGSRARAVYVSSPGITPERLGTPGRRFVARFGASRPGGIVDPWAVYAAQAAEVLLDAIARSDGSRPSVSRALFATDIRDGLVGDVRFDANGDVHPRPYTIIRLSPDAAGVTPGGANIAAVISP